MNIKKIYLPIVCWWLKTVKMVLPIKVVVLFCGFLLLFYAPNVIGRASELCSKAFTKKSIFTQYQFVKNPLSETLVTAFQTAEQLKYFDSKKQAKEFRKGMEQTIQWIENPADPQKLSQYTTVTLKQLVNKLSQIMKFNEQLSSEEVIYFKQTTQAVLAVFSKHIPIIIKEENPSQTDLPRINLILQSIVDFNLKDPRFSIYKIKRTIEGRYSLREFILCKP